MEIGFYHGVLYDSYETQANNQGFTLGDKAEKLQDLFNALMAVRFGGLLTDSQYTSALNKLQKKISNACKPLQTENSCSTD